MCTCFIKSVEKREREGVCVCVCGTGVNFSRFIYVIQVLYFFISYYNIDKESLSFRGNDKKVRSIIYF